MFVTVSYLTRKHLAWAATASTFCKTLCFNIALIYFSSFIDSLPYNVITMFVPLPVDW